MKGAFDWPYSRKGTGRKKPFIIINLNGVFLSKYTKQAAVPSSPQPFSIYYRNSSPLMFGVFEAKYGQSKAPKLNGNY